MIATVPIPTRPADDRPVEIACDESGYEGDKLIGSTTDVFAHASVRLDTEPATACMQELRKRIRSPATEYKAGHLLREKHRLVLEWLLGSSGPLLGNAHVYLIDKAFYVLGRVVDLLLSEVTRVDGSGPLQDPRARAMAVALYREARSAIDRDRWEDFLAAANNLLRTKDRLDVSTPIESFHRAIDALRVAGGPEPVDEVLGQLRQARPQANSFRARLLDEPRMVPALDPLIPAIVRAVVHWSRCGTPVSIVHDRQNTLSEERIAQLTAMLAEPGHDPAGGATRGRLAGLSLVDSFVDPRVQLADVLAGVARKIASDELNGRGDARLTELLRPYVDAYSIWGDDRSWPLLRPTSSTRSE